MLRAVHKRFKFFWLDQQHLGRIQEQVVQLLPTSILWKFWHTRQTSQIQWQNKAWTQCFVSKTALNKCNRLKWSFGQICREIFWLLQKNQAHHSARITSATVLCHGQTRQRCLTRETVWLFPSLWEIWNWFLNNWVGNSLANVSSATRFLNRIATKRCIWGDTLQPWSSLWEPGRGL